ncbi:hypothetical protein D8I24_6531 [Cupriavidus necator H850]|uniref:hypothetical protein n=1 Tax=Cupriavidus necator TaxID=106590 RepID=UPI00129D84AC|nr:hypothetical protein [Cupriavidus necator]KAI3597715.1 hypothetical protein D8I24_6531 [Cupriavidus necator H850]
MKLGDLLIKLGLDLSDYTRGLSKAQADTQGFGKNIGEVAGEARGKIGDFAQETVTKVAAAVAAFAGVSAVLMSVKSSIDGLDAVDELSERLAVNATTLQKYAYQAHFYGLGLDEVGGAVKKLSTNMAEAAGGGKDQAALFRALGVSVVDAGGQLRDVDTVMADVMEKFSDMEDGAGKTALAVDLFGKSGANLNAWLSSGADGIKKAAEEAERFGVIVPEAATKAAGDFNDNLDRMAMVARGTFNQINAAALPAMNAFMEAMIEAATETDSLNQSAQRLRKDGTLGAWAMDTARVLGFIVDAGQGVYRTFELIGKGIGAAAAQAVLLAQGEFKAASAAGNAFLSDADAILNRKLFSQVLEQRLAQMMADADGGEGSGDDRHKRKAPVQNKAGEVKESEADKLIKSLHEQIAVQDAVTASTKELTDGEKAYAKFLEDLRIGKDASLKQSKAQITALYQEVIAGEKAARSRKEYLEARDKEWDAIEKGTDALRTNIETALLEGQAIGLNKQQLVELESARLAEQAAAKRSKAAIYDLMPGYEAQAAALREQADLLNVLADQKLANARKQSRADEAEETAKEWSKVADQINQSLTDSFFRAFENGASYGKAFLDGLKNMFKATLLRIPFQYVQTTAMTALGFGSNAANAASGNGGSTDWLGYGRDAYNLAFGGGTALSQTGSLNLSYMGDFMASGAFGAGTGASIFGSGVSGVGYGSNAGLSLYGTGSAMSLSGGSAGLSATAGSAASNLSWLNGASGLWGAGAGIAGGLLGGALFNNKGYSAMGGSLGAIGGLAVAGSSAAAASALGASIGSALPVVGTIIGAVAGAALGSLIGGGGETRYGASYAVDANGRAQKFAGPSGGDRAAEQVTAAIGSTYASMEALATQFGGSMAGLGQFKASYEVSPKKGNSFVAAGFGDGWYPGREDLKGEKDPEKVMAAFELQLQRSIIQGLQQANLEAPFAEFLSGIDASKLSATDVQSVLGTLDALKSFSDAVQDMPFKGFAQLSAAAAMALAKAAGGMDALVNGLTTYYQTFYSAEEQQALAQDQLAKQFAALNVVMPQSKEAFRAMMEGIDLSSDSGRKLYANLLEIAPAFAQMTDVLGQAGQAMEAFGKQVQEFQQSLGLSNLSTLTPEQQYAEARRRYEATSAAAQGGDAEAQAKWTQIAQAFLEASRGFYASGGQYAADYAAVQGFRPDGSHAGGLDYVPFDGYLAELHKGERVLTRAESAQYAQSPNWSQYGQGANAALVAEVKALRNELATLRESVGQVEAIKEAQAAARHEEAMAVQAKQVRLQQDLLNK